jgi:glucose-fructose oxidoreductase
MTLTVDGRKRTRTYPQRDQFAPELLYFSDCVLQGKEPEPSGIEGLLDVHVIRSLQKSIETGIATKLRPLQRRRRPTLRQEIHRPPARRTTSIHAKAPAR